MQAVTPFVSRGVLVVLLCSGCTARIDPLPAAPAGEGSTNGPNGGEGGSGGSNSPISVDDLENLDCSGIHPGAAPLRTLNPYEYDNTVRDLLGDDSRPAARAFPRGGAASADANVTSLVAERYMTAAEDVAERATQANNLASLLGCTPDGEGSDTCARSFIDALLPRAYRRPVAQDERDAVLDLFGRARSALDYRGGLQVVLEAVLQSPNFLYRAELPDSEGSDAVPLNDYQVASRLSYFFWGTMPDASLFTKAKEGRLQTKAAVETEARRLLSDPRAEAMFDGFFAEYLSLDDVLDADKSPEVYPDFNPEMASLMQQETRGFVREVLAKGDGNLRTLLQAPWSMMNEQLAEYYGVRGPQGPAFARVELAPDQHAGLLTQGALLAARAHATETSPIHRGIFIRDRVMCGTVPDVPEGLDTTLPDPDPNLTTRQRLTEHRANPVCASCHERLDPLGFAFEHFDGAGRFRAEENGLPIDTSGFVIASDLVDDKDAKVPFNGIVELADKLAESPEVQLCFSKHWFRYAYGRVETREDGCALRSALKAFQGTKLDVRELLVALTQTDAFMYRNP